MNSADPIGGTDWQELIDAEDDDDIHYKPTTYYEQKPKSN
jgi:hypothetical protein